MAIKKSEIYSQIWAACDKLRGGVEPARYKDYILTLLFVKYVSDRFKGDPYADIVIPESGSFDKIVELKGKPNIGEGINIVISALAEANELKGVIDVADFNSDDLGTDKEAVDKLTGLVAIFEKPELNFEKNKAGGDDILGDAYEYLMKKFAVDSGKSKGQFYTPGEVSRIMAKVIGIDKAEGTDKTVYDPACGSGSLLIRAADEAPVREDGTSVVAIYGQEKDKATAGLARMNLVLHNKANGVISGNKSTISSPEYKDDRNPTLLKRFDYIVVNPPFSDKSWMDGIQTPDLYGRFDGFETPPEKNGDYAWFLHVLKSLKSDGKAAIILPHGVLFRGNAEANIRKEIIDRGYIKGIIGLPANLFYGTGIPACIIIVDKEDAEKREGIFMIDASKGYIKDGNKNRLREQDIHRIVTVFNHQMEIEKYSRFVPNREIKKDNEYNLNIPRYIDNSEPEDLQDINAHLNGGIPCVDIDSLNAYWSVYPSIKNMLFETLREGYYKAVVAKEDIVSIILNHEEFIAHAEKVDEAYSVWKEKVMPILSSLTVQDNPKSIVKIIAESLLEYFEEVELIDEYDIYQVLMEYWEEIMQDDIYAICYDGYGTGKEIAYEYVMKKDVKTDKIKSFEGKLIPKKIIIESYFAVQEKTIQKLSRDLGEVVSKMEEMIEENAIEDGLFSELDDMKKATITARMKAIKGDPEAKDEIEALKQYSKLMDAELNYKKAIKQAEEDLDKLVSEQYCKLTIDEIKEFLIEKKWFASIYDGIDSIHQAVSHRLSNRLVEVVERYEFTMGQCSNEVNKYEMKVKSHLERMGFKW